MIGVLAWLAALVAYAVNESIFLPIFGFSFACCVVVGLIRMAVEAHYRKRIK